MGLLYFFARRQEVSGFAVFFQRSSDRTILFLVFNAEKKKNAILPIHCGLVGVPVLRFPRSDLPELTLQLIEESRYFLESQPEGPLVKKNPGCRFHILSK